MDEILHPKLLIVVIILPEDKYEIEKFVFGSFHCNLTV